MNFENKQIEFNSNGLILRGIISYSGIKNAPLVIMATGDSKSGSKSGFCKMLIPKLLDKGINVFVFDFPGKGISDGDDSLLTVKIGLDSLSDAYNIIMTHDFYDKSRVGLIGSSFGGLVGIIFLARNKTIIKALALKSPSCFYPEVYELWVGLDGLKQWQADNYSQITERYWNSYIEGFDYNCFLDAQSINIPCIIVHGNADKTVPVVHTHRLNYCLKGETDILILDGVDHGYKEDNALKVATDKFSIWFSSKL
ncbi:MAG: alpha/beta hydrolase [Firmicutes bacterium]|nr:alpha/beta hydrolase [Bacillota bacterium]